MKNKQDEKKVIKVGDVIYPNNSVDDEIEAHNYAMSSMWY